VLAFISQKVLTLITIRVVETCMCAYVYVLVSEYSINPLSINQLIPNEQQLYSLRRDILHAQCALILL